jgi:hypothetical protein
MSAATQVGPQFNRREAMRRAAPVKTNGLTEEVATLTAERDALAAEDGGQPLLAVLTLAVLAGATAGFAMAWLAGRPGPTVKVSPAPRGVDPA